MGLIVEDRGSEGYFGLGVMIERVREVVKNLLDEFVGSNLFGLVMDVLFFYGSKRVFEVVLEYFKKMGYNYIVLEYIVIVFLVVDDGGVSKVFDKYVFFDDFFCDFIDLVVKYVL